MTESTVLKAIKEGDVGTAKWYLAHKAKSRGYVSRQELEHSGEVGTVIKVTITDD
jgi:FAD synthase